MTPNIKGWIRANCPLCADRMGSPDRKRSFGFSATSGFFSCYRCSAGGRVREKPEEFAEYTQEDLEELPAIEPPDGFAYLVDEPTASALSFAAAWDYLLGPTPNGRGLTEEQVALAGIGVTTVAPFHQRVIVPVFDRAGAWAWHVGRSWTKKAETPYLYPKGGRQGLLYNERAIFDATNEPLLLVEGCFDAIPFLAARPGELDAVAFLGKPTEEQLDKLASARRPLAFVLDGDAFDEAWALMNRMHLAGKVAGSVKLPPRIDPDEVERERLLDAVRRCIDEGEVAL